MSEEIQAHAEESSPKGKESSAQKPRFSAGPTDVCPPNPHLCMLKSQEANVNPLGHRVPDST